MKLKDLKSVPTERISLRLLYAMIILTAVVFACFGLIGYDRPSDENPAFNAPLFTNVLMGLMYFMLVAGVGVAVWSVARSARYESERCTNGIPGRRIAMWVVGGTAVLLLVTFLFGSSTPLTIGGHAFESWAWLKLADMFIYTSLVLVLAAVATVVYGNMKYIRKKHD